MPSLFTNVEKQDSEKASMPYTKTGRDVSIQARYQKKLPQCI